MLVAGRTGVDRSRRRAACPRHAQRRRIQGAVGALRRCEDLRNHPALRLLSDRVVSRERARSATGGKSSEVSDLVVIASEAKQSRRPKGSLDCFVAFAPRNDGGGGPPRYA